MSHQTYRGEYRVVTADNETILDLDALQGTWTEEQYLRLTDYSRRLVEFTNGSIEILVPPTDKHQSISARLLLALHPIAQGVGGVVLHAPSRLRLGELCIGGLGSHRSSLKPSEFHSCSPIGRARAINLLTFPHPPWYANRIKSKAR